MFLLTFKETGPIVGHDDLYKTGIAGRRWAVGTNKWLLEDGVIFYSLGITHQLKTKAGEWWPSAVGYYNVNISFSPRTWLTWGYSRIYYDGSHCSLHLGPIALAWFSWKYGPEDDCEFGWGFKK